MTITDDELKAMAVELCLLRGEQPNSVDRGGVERWERYKPLAEGALREAERLFALRQSSPPDGQAAGEPEGYREAIIGVLRPAGNIAFSMKQQAIFTSDRDNYRRISVAIDAALDLLRDTPSSETKAPARSLQAGAQN